MLENFILNEPLESKETFRDLISINQDIYPKEKRIRDNLFMAYMGTVYFIREEYELACYRFNPGFDKNEEFPIWGYSAIGLEEDETYLLCYEHYACFVINVEDPRYKKFKMRKRWHLIKSKSERLLRKCKINHKVNNFKSQNIATNQNSDNDDQEKNQDVFNVTVNCEKKKSFRNKLKNLFKKKCNAMNAEDPEYCSIEDNVAANDSENRIPSEEECFRKKFKTIFYKKTNDNIKPAVINSKVNNNVNNVANNVSDGKSESINNHVTKSATNNVTKSINNGITVNNSKNSNNTGNRYSTDNNKRSVNNGCSTAKGTKPPNEKSKKNQKKKQPFWKKIKNYFDQSLTRK